MLDVSNEPMKVRAIKVHQWLSEWDKVPWDDESHASKPTHPWFLVFSVPASTLLPLCGIQPRRIVQGQPRAKDTGIQRQHDPKRSRAIREYIQYGYPYSELSQRKRNSGDFGDLRKPGWLPTAVVLNILAPGDKRREQVLSREAAIKLEDDSTSMVSVVLPARPPGIDELAPLEIIDGQHRLFAFRDWDPDACDLFEVPVVAFYGLDISWQAYLFWTINVTPKRINPSLAFDLYPLLRQEEWLERFHGHSIYREARAQELTARLWEHPDSPWYHRIDMLGDGGRRLVTQNAWVRSLFATFLKRWEEGPTRSRIGGLFGARLSDDSPVLPWDLAMQTAFLILAWQHLRIAIEQTKAKWAEDLRGHVDQDHDGDLAFLGRYSLLNTEQGVRGVLYTYNDLCFASAKSLGLLNWQPIELEAADDTASIEDISEDSSSSELASAERVRAYISDMRGTPLDELLSYIAVSLASYDWRTSDTPELPRDVRDQQMGLRGSGGYAALRERLLYHLSTSKSTDVAAAANEVIARLGLAPR